VEVEGDTEEAFQARRRLVKLLVQSISAGKQPDDGRTEIKITYRFGPPPAEVSEGSSVVHLKNGRESYTPATDAPTLTVVAVK
jgi:hypothetical protein